MASLSEILAILELATAGADMLASKVGVAALIAAGIILDGDDTVVPFSQVAGMHEKRLVWAAQAMARYRGADQAMFYAVIAANSTATQTQILQAGDIDIQSAVNRLIDGFATAVTMPPPA